MEANSAPLTPSHCQCSIYKAFVTRIRGKLKQTMKSQRNEMGTSCSESRAQPTELHLLLLLIYSIRKNFFLCFILAPTVSIISRTEMPNSSRRTAGAVQRGCNVAEAGQSIGCTVKGATIRLKKKMPQYNACNVTLICFINASQHHFVIKEMIHTFTFAAVKQKSFKRFLADYKQSYWCCVVLCREYKNP